MARKTSSRDAPFQTIPRACEITGLSQKYLRKGCQEGEIPHIKVGNTFYINIPALYRKMEVTV